MSGMLFKERTVGNKIIMADWDKYEGLRVREYDAPKEKNGMIGYPTHVSPRYADKKMLFKAFNRRISALKRR